MHNSAWKLGKDRRKMMVANEENKYTHYEQPTTLPVEGECAWYILRYQVLTKYAKYLFIQNPDTVFFPYRTVLSVRQPQKSNRLKSLSKTKAETEKPKVVPIDKPYIPGYVFVKGPIDRAMDFCGQLNLNLWMKSTDERHRLYDEYCATPTHVTQEEQRAVFEHQYYSVSHKAMLRFMQAVSYYKCDMQLFDASDIDIEQDDEVEFISGPMKGQRGRVRTTERKSGGIVIIPMTDPSQKGDDSISDATSSLAEGRGVGSSSFLCYGINAKPSDYRIVRFANNTRNKYTIHRANTVAKEMLSAYSQGKIISEKDLKRLKAYVLRYADVQPDTDIQRANITLLLYRLYTILGLDFNLVELRKAIDAELLPYYAQRIEDARGIHKSEAIRQRDNFLNAVKEIEDAPKCREEALAVFQQKET